MTESQADTERRKSMMFDTFGLIGKVAEFFGSTKLFVGLTVLFADYMIVTGAFTVQCTLWGCALLLFFAHMSD